MNFEPKYPGDVLLRGLLGLQMRVCHQEQVRKCCPEVCSIDIYMTGQGKCTMICVTNYMKHNSYNGTDKKKPLFSDDPEIILTMCNIWDLVCSQSLFAYRLYTVLNHTEVC